MLNGYWTVYSGEQPVLSFACWEHVERFFRGDLPPIIS
jgi:hypothetical protein